MGEFHLKDTLYEMYKFHMLNYTNLYMNMYVCLYL